MSQHKGIPFKKINWIGWPYSLCYSTKLLPTRTLWPIFKTKDKDNGPLKQVKFTLRQKFSNILCPWPKTVHHIGLVTPKFTVRRGDRRPI
jgi:hypothetical protein